MLKFIKNFFGITDTAISWSERVYNFFFSQGVGVCMVSLTDYVTYDLAKTAEFFAQNKILIWLALLMASCFILWFRQLLKINITKTDALKINTRDHYEYGINLVNLSLAYDPNNTDQALQIGVIWENVSDSPIKYHVDNFSIILNEKTISQPTFVSKSNVIPKCSTRQFLYPSLKKEVVNIGRSTGILEYSIRYGHPDFEPVRLLKHRLQILMEIRENLVAITYLFEQEEDKKIKS